MSTDLITKSFISSTIRATGEVLTKHPVRVVMIDGNPWFVAADVCAVLQLTNVTKALYALGSDEKQTVTLTLGKGNPHRALIAESGLYKLIMRSDKPIARKFQDWVTKDVLPAIRKDGAYVMGEEKVATGELSEDENTKLKDRSTYCFGTQTHS